VKRLLVWAALGLAVVALTPACLPVTPGPGPGPAPGGLALRLERPAYRVATFGSTGGGAVATDSLEVSAAWTAPAADQYGPVDSVRAVVLGGYPTRTVVRALAPAVVSLVVNLPLNLAGAGSPQSVGIDARVCVQTFRRGVAGPEVCRDTGPVTITFPAPAGVSGLTATAAVRAFP